MQGKTLSDSSGKELKQAGASTPVILTGFKELPKFGDTFKVYKSEKEARQAAQKYSLEHTNGDSYNRNMTSTELIRRLDKQRDQKEIPIIVRADVQGSLTSVLQSIQGLEHEEVKIRVVGSEWAILAREISVWLQFLGQPSMALM